MIDTERLMPIVGSMSASVWRRYPAIDKRDAEGVLWEWIYSNPDHVKNYLESESIGLLCNRLRTVGLRWAAKENEIINGREPSDLYLYNPRTVSELLKDMFDYQDWQSASQVGDGMPTAKRLVNESGDRMAMLADVSSALKQVPTEQYNVLVWTYKYHYPYAKLAETLGISEEAARMRVSRAVRKVVQILMGQAPSTAEGADPEYIGARKVITNATSRAISSSQWD